MPRPARPGAHDALLDAARKEFARRGLDGARVEDIARRAGVSKGAFYLHFRTKEEAFAEILQRLLGALEEHARRRHEAVQRLDAAGDPGAAARRLDLECQLDTDLLGLLWLNRHLLAALDTAGGPVSVRLVGDFRRRMRALVAVRIADRQRAGDLRSDVDPDVLGDLVVGTYEAFVRRMADLPSRPDLAAWVRSFVRVVYEGLLSPASRAAPKAAPTARPSRAAARR